MANLKLFDSKDDRREIWHLLHRLPPGMRVEWLRWCCRQCPTKYPLMPNAKVYTAYVAAAGKHDRPDEVLTNEVFLDWWRLASQHGLDQDATAKRLVEVARKKGY